jgi:hypothetical protein
VDPWLTAKRLALVAYVGAGLVALALFLYMLAVATTRSTAVGLF